MLNCRPLLQDYCKYKEKHFTEMTKQSRITLHTIAQEAGVSTSTVSRVLNNYEHTDATTRARVQRIASRLGYKGPAANDQRAQNNVLSVIMYWVDPSHSKHDPASGYNTSDHAPSILFSIEQTAQAHGYHLILNSFPATVTDLPSSIHTRFAGGALLLGGLVEDTVIELIAREVPTVFVGSFVVSGSVSAVHIDYRLGASQAVAHLIALGHRHIALLNGPLGTNTSTAKRAGFLEACWSHDLPLERSLVVDAGSFDYADGRAAAEQLLAQGRFTALVAGTDVLASGALAAVQARGLRVPQDISIVTLYNAHENLMYQADFELTGVEVPFKLIGQLAVERLLALIANPQPPTATVIYPEFKIGASSGPAPEG